MKEINVKSDLDLILNNIYVEDGGDEIDRAQDRGRAGDVQRQDRHVDGRSGRPAGRKRRIDGPAGPRAIAGAAGDEGRTQKQREGRDE